MIWLADRLGRLVGLATVPLGLAQYLEEGYGDEATNVFQRRVARLVPIWIILSANHMEEIAFLEAQLLVRLGLVVVERADNLDRRDCISMCATTSATAPRRTFFGGTMAMADLGVIEICWVLASFSPLIDLRRA